MSEALAEKRCTPCRGGIPPLTRDEAERLQAQAPDWELRDDEHRIERTFRFRNFREALTFVGEVGGWRRPKGTTPTSASAGVTRPSPSTPKRSRDCTRTISSWRARSTAYSIDRLGPPSKPTREFRNPYGVARPGKAPDRAIVLTMTIPSSPFSAEPAFLGPLSVAQGSLQQPGRVLSPGPVGSTDVFVSQRRANSRTHGRKLRKMG
jgi:4a-hydroxytetrahydrobiopterin dehydratase